MPLDKNSGCIIKGVYFVDLIDAVDPVELIQLIRCFEVGINK
jgi:imidazole glycerol phosphate synthase subunit HisF